MVVRTRRALRDRTPAPNAVPQAGPSSSYAAKRRKTIPLHAQGPDESLQGKLSNEPHTTPLNQGTPSNTLPGLQSTPIPNKNRQKRRHHVPYPTKLSSSLPPSSPLATSPVYNANLDDDDDPFGFLVAERKLKAQRVGMKIDEESRRQRVYDENGIEDMYATDDEYDVGGEFITPAATTGEQEPLDSPDLYPPRTPSKRSNKRKLVESPASTPGSSTPRIPSSPSPVKLSEMAHVATRPAVKRKGLNDRPKKKVRANVLEVEEDMDPSMMAEHLESLLPKRPARKVTQRVVKKARIDDGSDASPEEKMMKKKGKKPSVRVGKKRPVSKGKTAKKAEISDLDKKQEMARRERIEYFKRLDDYELAKENVYVV